MKAIIFGSIGTLVETSDIQRQSFNYAFKEVGLDWYWDKSNYKKLLKKMMKSSLSNEERKKKHQEKIRQSLGGGQLQKLQLKIEKPLNY